MEQNLVATQFTLLKPNPGLIYIDLFGGRQVWHNYAQIHN